MAAPFHTLTQETVSSVQCMGTRMHVDEAPRFKRRLKELYGQPAYGHLCSSNWGQDPFPDSLTWIRPRTLNNAKLERLGQVTIFYLHVFKLTPPAPHWKLLWETLKHALTHTHWFAPDTHLGLVIGAR